MVAKVTKTVPDFRSPSLPAFLPQSAATDSEFLAQFSHPHYVDSSTFQWKTHPSFRPRKPLADQTANSAPAVPATPPLAARHIPVSQLLANCITALAPGLDVPSPPPITEANSSIQTWAYDVENFYQPSASKLFNIIRPRSVSKGST